MVSPQKAPPAPASLPMEADPSGFTERAPALVSLLPDEALSLALANGDVFAVHAALTARLAREGAGAARDTLRELLAHRALFVVAERPPSLHSFLGTGIALTGLPPAPQQETPFIARRAICLFGVPVWSLGEHLARRGRDGQLEVLGRVAGASGSRTTRWGGFLAIGSVILAGTGLAVAPFFEREVQLVNGLSHPVEVRLNERLITLQPGEIAKQELFGLGSPHHVEARWVGAQTPFEVLSLESTQRAVYNILGAATLEVGNASNPRSTHRLEGRTGSLESQDEMLLQGSWERTVRDLADAGKWSQAADLARAIFLADPSALQAGEQAALLLVHHSPVQALGFARELQRTFQADPVIGRLAQDIFLALGERSEAFTLYNALAQTAPESVQKALMAVRVAPPEQQRTRYALVLDRFPDSPEALRAVARVRLADGYAKEALDLLERALAKGPESLEELELRVRTLGAVKRFKDASAAVRKFAEDPSHRTWELTLLAGRLARIAGPSRTQYISRDLIPPALTRSPEHMVTFALLTGESSATEEEVKAVQETGARDALELTRTVFKDWDKAVEKASMLSDKALSLLDPETAALLALELSHSKGPSSADRLFNSSLSLMAARKPLEAYVLTGEVKPDFPWLPPGLQAAAHLVRARVVPDNRFVEQAYARWADVLGGMARRALDAKYEEPSPQLPPSPRRFERSFVHFTLFGLAQQREAAAKKAAEEAELARLPQAPKPEGDRIPRPWPAP